MKLKRKKLQKKYTFYHENYLEIHILQRKLKKKKKEKKKHRQNKMHV